jgi:molybdate transport system permease protein
MDWSPLLISLKTATLATVISIVIGLPISYGLSREWRGKSIASGLILLPLVLPPTVLGYFLLVVLGRRSIVGSWYELFFHQSLVFTWQGAAVAASVASLPLMISQSTVAFASVSNSLLEAARIGGAKDYQVLRHITLPLARRGILAGVTLAFARSLGDFGATLMVAGDIPGVTQTMPLAIYDAVQTGDNRTILIFVITASCIAITATIAASRFSEP